MGMRQQKPTLALEVSSKLRYTQIADEVNVQAFVSIGKLDLCLIQKTQ